MKNPPIPQHHLDLVLAVCRKYLACHVQVRKVTRTYYPQAFKVWLSGVVAGPYAAHVAGPHTARVVIYNDNEIFLTYGCMTCGTSAELLKDFIVPGVTPPVQCGTTVPAATETEE